MLYTGLLCLLLQLCACLHQVAAVDILQVTLIGTAPNEDYIKVNYGNTQQEYSLQCQYRAGYDDTVQRVTWLLYGQEVYSWNAAPASVIVSPPLRGRVAEGADSSVRVVRPHLSLAGTYNCRVDSTKGTTISDPLHLHVVDISPEPYETHVEVLSYYSLEEDNSTTAAPPPTASWQVPAPPTPSSACVLVWGMRTPAIAPRPNVTCGYYSYTADAITQVVPGGVELHQLPGGKWRAVIPNTRIPVMAIPPQDRLGCSVSIPHTSYRKIVKFEDGLRVDMLIDTKGCSNLEYLNDLGLTVSTVGATTTCRGDNLPVSSSEPAIATISCPVAARHRDGRMEADWRLRLQCAEDQLVWRIVVGHTHTASSDDPMMVVDSGEHFDELNYQWPLCVGMSGAGGHQPRARLIVTALLIFAASFIALF